MYTYTTLRTPHKVAIYSGYCRHFVWFRMHLHMFVYIQNSWNVETPVFCKAARSPSSNCSMILALLLIVLAFLNILQQWRGPKVQYLLLNSLRTHYHSYQKYTGILWNTPHSGHAHSSVPNSVHFRGVPLYYSGLTIMMMLTCIQ